MAIHSRGDHHEHGHKTRRRPPASLSHMRLRTMQRGIEENRTQICFFCRRRSPAFCHNCTRCKGGENCGEMLREKEEGKRKEEGEPPFFPFLVRRRGDSVSPPFLRTESFPPCCIQYVYDASKDGGRKREASERLHAGRRTVNRKRKEVRDSAIGRQVRKQRH